jgi:hypothetical protein
MPRGIVQTIILEGAEADSRLSEIGLDRATLQMVVLQGEQARAEATSNDPVNAAGWDAYRYRVRAFRDEFGPAGWTVDHAGGLEKTWSPDGKHVVITRAGDAGVGIRNARPQPKRKAGAEVRGVVEGANLLLDPNWMNVVPPPHDESPEFATWLLLVWSNGDLVRGELSAPIGLKEDDTVLGWYERILLPEIDLSGPTDSGRKSSDADEVIDVPVIRKKQ